MAVDSYDLVQKCRIIRGEHHIYVVLVQQVAFAHVLEDLPGEPCGGFIPREMERNKAGDKVVFIAIINVVDFRQSGVPSARRHTQIFISPNSPKPRWENPQIECQFQTIK